MNDPLTAPPIWLPESPEFWRAMGEWLADGRPLTESERAYHLAVCEAQRVPVQPDLLTDSRNGV